MNKLPTGTLSSLPAYRQLNQGRSSLLQNMTVCLPSPFPISSYGNFIFAFYRMNLLSLSSFPCAKVNSTLIINSIPLDYSLMVFIIFPPSHHSPSFSTWNLPMSLSLSSALVTLQTSNGCLLGWSTVLVCPGLRLVVGWFWDHPTLSFKTGTVPGKPGYIGHSSFIPSKRALQFKILKDMKYLQTITGK